MEPNINIEMKTTIKITKSNIQFDTFLGFRGNFGLID